MGVLTAMRGTLSGQSCEAGRRVLVSEIRRKEGPWEWTSTGASAVGVAVAASSRRGTGAHAAPVPFYRRKHVPTRTTHPSADILRNQQQGGLAANQEFGQVNGKRMTGVR